MFTKRKGVSMGKDSLIKSTSKGKASSVKGKAAPKTKTRAKPPKAAGSRQQATGTQKKTPPRSEAAAQPAAVKAVAAQPTGLSTRELLFKRFGPWTPPHLFRAAPERSLKKVPDAPPLAVGRSPEDTRRIKALLLKTFDLKATAPSAPAPETARPVTASPVLSGAIPEAAPRAQSEAEAASAAPAPQAQAPRTYATAADVKGSDPVEKSVKYLLGIFALVVLVVIAASYANTSRYQLKPASGGIEIWRGRFAPMGEALMTKIPGMQLPLPAKEVYSEAEALPLVSKYYLDKADALLDAPGIPDFESIRANLKEAMTYATTGTLRQAAAARLNTIDMMVLVYKAEVSATKGTPAALQDSLGYLEQAAALDLDSRQAEMIKQKILSTREQLTGKAEPQPAPPAKTPDAQTK
jgi:hypothetical protein